MSITSAISNKSGQRTGRSCVRQRFLHDYQVKSAHAAHHEFKNKTANGFGRYSANIATPIGDDGKRHFTGDNDVWVFVNGELVVDRGGDHAAHDQDDKIDRLGLSDGDVYEFDLFFAERHRVLSNFRIQLSMSIESIELPTSSQVDD